MASKIRDRSGRAVASYCHYLDWRPQRIVQAGVGVNCAEARIFAREWPGIRLIGFEPHPGSIPADYPGTIVPAALGRSRGRVTLLCKPRHADGSTTRDLPGDRKLDQVEVEQVPLDDVMIFSEPETLLWLDCEGSEAEALWGAERFLAQVKLINVELTGRPPGRSWAKPEELHEILRKAGFYHAWTHTTRSRGGQSDAIYVRRELFDPTLCCCPAEIERYHRESEG